MDRRIESPSEINIIRRQMPLQFHGIMQDAADADDIGSYRPIKQQMAGCPDDSFESAHPLPAVAQVVAADCESEFRPGGTAKPFRIGCDNTQRRRQQRLVAPAHGATEPILGPG